MERPLSGFTLIELLLTVAIMAILAAGALPTFKGLISRNHVLAADNALVGALNFTRQRAVTAAQRTILCPSTDGARCNPNNHWEGGWLVAFDHDHDGQPDAAPLMVQTAIAAGTVIVSTQGRTRVQYHADGSSPGSNVSLVICHRGEPRSARKVVVSNSGRPRQARASAAQAATCAAA